MGAPISAPLDHQTELHTSLQEDLHWLVLPFSVLQCMYMERQLDMGMDMGMDPIGLRLALPPLQTKWYFSRDKMT